MAISEDAARDYLHDAAARAAPAPATAVIDRLYVGPFLYAKSLSWLRRHGITHVVNATPGAPCIHEAAGIVYLRISIEDRPGAPIGDHFEASRTFITRALLADGAVLVHCQMGQSRSVSLACAYLMSTLRIGWREALERVRQARPTAAPNSGFIRALRDHEASLDLEHDKTPPARASIDAAPSSRVKPMALRHGLDGGCSLEESAQCSCKELPRLRGFHCTICSPESEAEDDDSAASVPGEAAATAASTPAARGTPAARPKVGGEPERRSRRRPRFHAFATMLEADPALDEVAYVPGPLDTALFEEGDADDGLVTAALPPIEVRTLNLTHTFTLTLTLTLTLSMRRMDLSARLAYSYLRSYLARS